MKDGKFILVEDTIINNCIRIVIFEITAKVLINIIIIIIIRVGV